MPKEKSPIPTITWEVLPGGFLPERAHESDAALDLFIPQDPALPETYAIRHGATTKIPLRLKVALPDNIAGLILPRSGLARDFGISIVNSPGLIDPGYRGELAVLLTTISKYQPGDAVVLTAGTRVAQFLPMALAFYDTEEGPVSEQTDRGTGGFGSSGLFDLPKKEDTNEGN